MQCIKLQSRACVQTDHEKRATSEINSGLVSYSYYRLETVGKVTLLVSTKDKYVPVEFEIVKNRATLIFGLKTCLELNLISRLKSI